MSAQVKPSPKPSHTLVALWETPAVSAIHTLPFPIPPICFRAFCTTLEQLKVSVTTSHHLSQMQLVVFSPELQARPNTEHATRQQQPLQIGRNSTDSRLPYNRFTHLAGAQRNLERRHNHPFPPTKAARLFPVERCVIIQNSHQRNKVEFRGIRCCRNHQVKRATTAFQC
jgi:hypothetical protein